MPTRAERIEARRIEATEALLDWVEGGHPLRVTRDDEPAFEETEAARRVMRWADGRPVALDVLLALAWSGSVEDPAPSIDAAAEIRDLTGAGRIAVERARQKLPVEAGGEGYDAAHDAEKEGSDSLAIAAVCYATPPRMRRMVAGGRPLEWPWDTDYWKPKDRIRDLERAGALIAAALDVELARKGTSDATDRD